MTLKLHQTLYRRITETCNLSCNLKSSKGLESGSPLRFNSSASFSPVPEITWKRANGVPFPSKVKMKYSNAVLEIPSFQQDDTGGYECVAENKMGKNIATGRLAFYGKTYFLLLAMTTKNIVPIKLYTVMCEIFAMFHLSYSQCNTAAVSVKRVVIW